MLHSYTVAVYEAEPDEGGFWAEVHELPGCVAQGESLDELRSNVLNAIQAWEATYEDLGGEPVAQSAFIWNLPAASSLDGDRSRLGTGASLIGDSCPYGRLGRAYTGGNW